MFKSKAKQLTDSFLTDAKGIQEDAWRFCGKMGALRSDASQLAGMIHKRCAVVTEGNLPVIAVVDNSTFEHNSRQKNLNWAHPAHDVRNFAAAACNYFRGTAIQSFHDDRGIRAGGFPQYEAGTDDV